MEKNDKNIRIPIVSNPEQFLGQNVRTIIISKDSGIKAVYSIDSKNILSFLFSKNKDWDIDKSKDWLKLNLNKYSESDIQDEEKLKSDDINTAVIFKGVETPIYPNNYKSFILTRGILTETIGQQINLGIDDLEVLKGGEGSGNFGHSGREGEVGGSSSEGGGESGNIRNSPDLINGVKSSDGKWTDDEGNKILASPAWTDVKYSKNPDSDVVCIGIDSKGRQQVIYSKLHDEKAALEKFSRIEDLSKNIGIIDKELNTDIKNGVEEAHVLKLIKETGIRPGSEKDTGAEKQAYGATTLQGQHVKVDKNGDVRLEYVGKKGVDLNIPIEDKNIKEFLISRKQSVGANEKIFNTDEKKLLDYAKSKDGGGFKTKDFRTYVGTTLAKTELEKYDIPKNAKQKQSYIKQIAKSVSKKLGNTPTVALQKYIDPRVFARWSTI